MENKITKIFDNLQEEEMDLLLAGDIEMEIDPKTIKRIKKSVYQKTGIHEKKMFFFRKPFWAVAAGITILLFGTISFVGFDQVSAKLEQLFSFIPGYSVFSDDTNDINRALGIGNKKIEYIATVLPESENDKAILTLDSVFVAGGEMSLVFEINKKLSTEELIQEAKANEEHWEKTMEMVNSGAKDVQVNFEQLALFAEENRYEKAEDFSLGGGKLDEATGNTTYASGSINYKLNKKDIDTNKTYTLSYGLYGLSVEFQLKKIENLADLEQLGAVATHNKISILAVPNFTRKRLEVTLYDLNKSKYTIEHIPFIDHDDENPDLQKVMYLEKADGTRELVTDDKTRSLLTNTKITFDTNPNEKGLVLRIPYIAVSTKEKLSQRLKVPKLGEKLKTNKKFAFDDSTLTISSIERTSPKKIKMTVKIKNHDPQKELKRALFYNEDRQKNENHYDADYDSNDVVTTVHMTLTDSNAKVLNLRLEQPRYWLTDDYSFNLDSER